MGAAQPHEHASQPRARFGILGPLAARANGALELPAPQLRAPLAVLLLHHGQPIPDERLAALLLPESRAAERSPTP